MRIEDQEHYGAWEKWYPLPEGVHLIAENSDRFEDIFSVFDLKDINLKTLLVLVGIKIKIVLDLRNLEAFDDELRKSNCKSAKKLFLNENKHMLDSIRENIIGKARGTSIQGEVCHVEIWGVTQQLLCSKSHDFLAVFCSSTLKNQSNCIIFDGNVRNHLNVLFKP